MPKITRRESIRISLQSLLLLVSVPTIVACNDEKPASSAAAARSDPALEPDDTAAAADETTSTATDTATEVESGDEDTATESEEETEEAEEPEELEPLSWDAFLVALAAIAASQHERNWDTESYVDEVGQLMQRLDPEAQPLVEAITAYADNSYDFPEITSIYEVVEFEVSVIQFEAGDVIELHNHPQMTGVILCLDGDIQIEAFNLLDEPSASGQLLLQKIDEVRLATGELATLTPERGNIHALEAHSFTILLDVFTPPYADERLEQYRWYGRSATAYDGRPDVFEAWEL